MRRLDHIYSLKSQIDKIAQRYNAEKVYIFGSCARKEDTCDSDVDLLVDFNEKASLFDQIGLQLDISDMLNCKVDIIPSTALTDPDFGASVKKDMVAL
ncbi:MAG: nucleotidyltransferase domain-containing protein [Lentisphaeria bacterium]|nr:nucleotidyltransferase domain-containing protein [Lentisphaeria bacterium]